MDESGTIICPFSVMLKHECASGIQEQQKGIKYMFFFACMTKKAKSSQEAPFEDV